MAESRLRAARLFTTENEKSQYTRLLISLNVVGNGFGLDVEFLKGLTDQRSETSGPAATCKSGSTGTSGGVSGYIVQILSEKIDEFIGEYLRSNEEFCN